MNSFFNYSNNINSFFGSMQGTTIVAFDLLLWTRLSSILYYMKASWSFNLYLKKSYKSVKYFVQLVDSQITAGKSLLYAFVFDYSE